MTRDKKRNEWSSAWQVAFLYVGGVMLFNGFIIQESASELAFCRRSTCMLCISVVRGNTPHLAPHHKMHHCSAAQRQCDCMPSADAIRGWWIWVYWINPLTYSLRALTLNEFTAPRWNIPDPQNPSQVMFVRPALQFCGKASQNGSSSRPWFTLLSCV